jgi:hypothetical protein
MPQKGEVDDFVGFSFVMPVTGPNRPNAGKENYVDSFVTHVYFSVFRINFISAAVSTDLSFDFTVQF